MSNDTTREGWAWLFNSRKWHYFTSADNKSLCRNWMLFSLRDVEPDTGPSKDDCAPCRRALDKRMPPDHLKNDLYGDCKCAVCLLHSEGTK